MLDVKNETPFAVGLMPGLDKDGVDHAVVVIKGTFDLFPRRPVPPRAAEQLPVVWVDTYHGDPAKTSMRIPGDGALRKLGTDIILVGSAHAPRGRVQVVDVAVTVGPVRTALRVFGDRKWHRSFGSWGPTDPAPFEVLPLVYERAFGGASPAGRDGVSEFEPRNPVGTGFVGSNQSDGIEGLPLPNLEDSADPIRTPKHRPVPMGLGAISPGWKPRRDYAGTMDDRWEKERCPLLPLDFDDRFFHAAPPDRITPTHLVGGEPVRLTNVTPGGQPLAFNLPSPKFEVMARIRNVESPHQARLDTVLLEPDAGRLVLCWRATIPCPRDFLRIDRIRARLAN